MENKTCGECRYLESVKKIGFCKKQEHPLCPSELPACSKFVRKVVTNGDVIRQGSDKELVIYKHAWSCDVCIYHDEKNKKCYCRRPKEKTCLDGMIDWLNAPAESQLNDAIQNVIKDGVKNAIDIHEDAYAPDMNVATKESEGGDV